MKTYISLLRGINVSGQKSIKMTDLKELYYNLGFLQVETYIQSGNVVFRTEQQSSDLELSRKIEDSISEKYGFDVPVVIRSLPEMIDAVEANPFAKDNSIDYQKVYISFISEKPNPILVENLSKLDYSPESFHVINQEVYLHCPIGYGNTKLSNNFFENRLKVKATTRNWNTSNKLIEIASGL